MVKLSTESLKGITIIPLDWAPLKRLLRFPPTFRQNLAVLVISLAGIIVLGAAEAYQHGLTLRVAIAMALLAALLAATGMLIYQERQSWAILRDLRAAISNIAPTYPSSLVHIAPPPSSTSALEEEIRALTLNWRDFCASCQRVHDTEMVQAEHLATMGELAAGVAHEIRNPLAGIAGAIEIISKDFPQNHPDREILDDLRQEVRRIEKVLNDLLTYARPKAPQFGMADLRETVAHTLQLARQQSGNKNVEFSIQIPSPLPRFRMDPEQLHQVLLNLVLNGMQALAQDGRITIRAQAVDGSGSPARHRLVEISVSDTGSGISREQQEKIFRPFYTTKRGGTGLGLSLCRRIISQHGGTLTVESEVGKGSRFIIRLPMREEVEEPQVLRARG